MTEHRGWTNTPAAPQLRHRHRQGKQRRLGAGGVLDRPLEHHVQQRSIEQALQRCGTVVENATDDRFGLIQLAPHAGILGTLAGEQERHFVVGCGTTAATAGADCPARQSASLRRASSASVAITASRSGRVARPSAAVAAAAASAPAARPSDLK